MIPFRPYLSLRSDGWAPNAVATAPPALQGKLHQGAAAEAYGTAGVRSEARNGSETPSLRASGDTRRRDARRAATDMDALAAEIAKKRKQVDGAKGGDAKRRWVRTADLQQQRRKDIEASAARKPVARPVVVEEVQPTTPKDDDRIEERVKALSKLPQGDVIKRLRQLGQPVTLFGETADERIRRLAIHDPRNEGEDDFRLRGGHEITEKQEVKEKDIAIEVLTNIAQQLIAKIGKGKLEMNRQKKVK